jgi:hypothetical protein
MREATEAALAKHPEDKAWIRRAIATAEKNLAAKEKETAA